MSDSTVFVGVDGSPESMVALHWAAGFVPLDTQMIAVRAWDFPVWSAFPSPLGGYPVPPVEEMEESAVEQLATAVELIDRPVRAEVIRGEPAAALTDRAGADDLIIVGTRGYGALRDWLLASVSTGCAAHADGPVVVVPSSARAGSLDRVVVGVDGSENSHRAVRWALDHVPDPTTIQVVAAWDTPVLYGFDPIVPDPDVYEEAARKRLDSVCDALGGSGVDCTRLETLTLRGDPRSALGRVAEEADLLVIGAQGRGGILHLLMGSVASSLVHCPKCPLAVVR